MARPGSFYTGTSCLKGTKSRLGTERVAIKSFESVAKNWVDIACEDYPFSTAVKIWSQYTVILFSVLQRL